MKTIQPNDPRLAIIKSDSRYDVDLDKLDLNYQPTTPIPSWKPTTSVPPYESLTKLYIDIETRGLDPETGRIYMVGLMNEKDEITIITNDCEKTLLIETMVFLTTNQPQVLVGHNHVTFDLPFLARRCRINGLSHPFKRYDKISKITSASVNGKPIEFLPIYWSGTHIIDTYHQIAIWDKAASKLSSYGLKGSVLALKLREDRRLELDYKQIDKCWVDGNLEPMIEYLKYDLDDTKLLADFLLPIVYYQLNYVPGIPFQALSTSSAIKHQKIHESLLVKEYANQYKKLPFADERVSYEGGKVGLIKSGLFSNVAKIDVASLYPSIMLRYCIASRKDPDNLFLGVLQYMRDERLRLKKLAKEGDRGSSFQEQSLKVLINCLAAGTLIKTSKGSLPIESLVDKEVKVVNGNGEWSPVVFKEYGLSSLYEITLTRFGKETKVKATPNHRWLAAPYSRRTYGRNKILREIVPFDEMVTEDLKVGMIVPHVKSPRPPENDSYSYGLIHGMVYGDGTYHNYKNYDDRYSISLYGLKKELEPYFHLSEKIRHISSIERIEDHRNDGAFCRVSFQNLTNTNLKKIPNFDEIDLSYVLGFIKGILATDGNVCKRDALTLISGKLELCEWVNKYGILVGYEFNTIGLASKAGRESIFKTHTSIATHDIYNLKFCLESMVEKDFLRTFHRENYKNIVSSRYFKMGMQWRIAAIKKLDTTEKVYCCEEPITSYFTLDRGILTGNSAYGYLGTGGYSFNDYEAACLIPAYGRKILNLMMSVIERCGGEILEIDTDGVFFTSTDAERVAKAVSIALPQGIEIDLEFQDCHIYLPVAKNYILVDKKGEVTVKGSKFRGRNNCPLQNEFQIEFIRLHFIEGKDVAEDYYLKIRNDLRHTQYPIDKLTITRKIGKAEVGLVERKIGNRGDVVSYWYADKNGAPAETKTNSNYSISYYVDMLDKLKQSIITNPIFFALPLFDRLNV